jgi:HK97 family phage major capsid protein
LNLTTASRTSAQTNASFGLIDAYHMVDNLPARWQPNSQWVGHWFMANLIRQQGSASNNTFWIDLNVGIPPLFLGQQFNQSSHMLNAGGTVGLSAATASSDNVLILGDFSQYVVVDRMGLEVVYNPLVVGASPLRPTGQVSWTAFWRTSADSIVDAAFQMLRV